MQAIPNTVPRLDVRPVPVAIYTRVSTLDQVGGRFDSCESQEELARQHIERNAPKGYYLSGVFPDPAYSGGSMKRPGMQALMRHIEAGCAEVVLIYKFERVLRSTDEWSSFRAFLKKHNCRLESPVEDLSEKTAMGRFNNNMRANLAEYHRLDTAEKVRVKMRLQAERGIWNSGQIPYGYDYNRETQTLQPNATEAAVVRRIFEATAQLVSLTDIANTLNAEGQRTKARVFQRRDGTREPVGARRFRTDHLRKILRNPIYLGRLRFRGDEFAAKHASIVTRELWDRANAAITKSVQPAPSRLQTRDKHGHLLKGLVFCGCCDRAMIPDFGGKRDSSGRPYRYYTCGAAHKERQDANCPIRHLPAALLENAVFGLMGGIGRREEIVQCAVDGAKTCVQSGRAELRDRMGEIDRELTQQTRRLANCIEAIAVGGTEAITDELRAKAATLKTEKERLMVERERLRQELATHELGAMDARRIAGALARFQELLPHLPPEEQRHLVALCVDRVEVRPKPAARSEGEAGRPIEIRLRLHAAQLVAGMEERVVVRVREARLAPINRRVMMLQSRLNLGGPRQPTRILTPFAETLGALPAAPPSRKAPEWRHPLHRALTWQRKLEGNPAMSHAALARKMGVSEPTVSRTLRMLRLLPEIQEILLRLKRREDLHHCSLNKVVALSALPPEAQRREFARLLV